MPWNPDAAPDFYTPAPAWEQDDAPLTADYLAAFAALPRRLAYGVATILALGLAVVALCWPLLT